MTFAEYGALLRFARSRRSTVPPGVKGAGRPFEIPAFSGDTSPPPNPGAKSQSSVSPGSEPMLGAVLRPANPTQSFGCAGGVRAKPWLSRRKWKPSGRFEFVVTDPCAY